MCTRRWVSATSVKDRLHCLMVQVPGLMSGMVVRLMLSSMEAPAVAGMLVTMQAPPSGAHTLTTIGPTPLKLVTNTCMLVAPTGTSTKSCTQELGGMKLVTTPAVGSC